MTEETKNSGPRLVDHLDNAGSQQADRNDSSSQSDIWRSKSEIKSRNTSNVKRDSGFCDFFTRFDLLGSQIDMNYRGQATYQT